eukprot:m.65756 g.65756  ORF g.65756 m.65756 type:complete len:684 (+) comp8314_c0_seq1:406-2457(+)
MSFTENRTNLKLTEAKNDFRLASVRRKNPLAEMGLDLEEETLSTTVVHAGTPNVQRSDDAKYRGIQVGMRVHSQQYNCDGTVAFVGLHRTKMTPRVGVVLDLPVGKLDGHQGGYQYFRCDPMYGILTSPKKLDILTDAHQHNGGRGVAVNDTRHDLPEDLPPSYSVHPPPPATQAAPATANEETPYGIATQFNAGSSSAATASPQVGGGGGGGGAPTHTSTGPTLRSMSGKSAHVRDEDTGDLFEMLDLLGPLPEDTADTTTAETTKNSSMQPPAMLPRARVASMGINTLTGANSGGGTALPHEAPRTTTACPDLPPRRESSAAAVATSLHGGRHGNQALSHSGMVFEAPGFVPGLDHEVASRKVLGALPGNYLIRESRSSDNLVLVVNYRGSVCQCTIFVDRDPMNTPSALTIQDEPFPTLASLLDWGQTNLYSQLKNSYGAPMPLGQPVSLEPWFAGDFTKAEVEKAVLAAPHGSFLIRKSSDERKFVVVVHDRGQAANFTIDPVPPVRSGNPATSYCFGTLSFNTLPDVIAWLKRNMLQGLVSERLFITHPAPIGTSASAPLGRAGGDMRGNEGGTSRQGEDVSPPGDISESDTRSTPREEGDDDWGFGDGDADTDADDDDNASVASGGSGSGIDVASAGTTTRGTPERTRKASASGSPKHTKPARPRPPPPARPPPPTT